MLGRKDWIPARAEPVWHRAYEDAPLPIGRRASIRRLPGRLTSISPDLDIDRTAPRTSRDRDSGLPGCAEYNDSGVPSHVAE